MSNYTVQQISSTSSGNISVAETSWSFMGLLLVAQLAIAPNPKADAPLTGNLQTRIQGSSKTFTQYANPLTGEYENLSSTFEESVASFYEQLLLSQEPLGKEFEKVLYDNFLDLLVRT